MVNDNFAYIRAINKSEEYLFNEVIAFSLDNEVFNLTGMSISDLMQMDYYSYMLLRDKVKIVVTAKRNVNREGVDNIMKNMKDMETRKKQTFNF